MSTRMIFGTPYPDFVKEVEEAFFAAMSKGYAGDSSAKPQVTHAGWKRAIVLHGQFSVIDEWNDEGGRTFINYINYHYDDLAHAHNRREEPPLVWVMRYVGHYEKWAIPLLKAALADRYEAREFCGGRGPKEYAPKYEKCVQEIVKEINASGGRKDSSPFWDGCVYGDFDFYENDYTGDFTDFRGVERVLTKHFPIAPVRYGGSHRFWGGMLI